MNSEPLPAKTATHRRLLWIVFWFLFFTTPALLISIPALFKHYPSASLFDDYGVVEGASSLLAGSAATAFVFARLRSMRGLSLVVATVGLGFLFAVLFSIIGYIGCSIVHV